MKISVTMITFNAERRLEECLNGIKWADEIIVVDCFSTDRTKEIASRFKNCKFYEKKFAGFGSQKNYATSKTSNDWIFNVDADEIVTDALTKEIEQALADPKFDGYYIPRKSFLGKKWIRGAGQWPDYQLRIYNKNKGKFEDKLVHERVIVSGKTTRLKNHFIHYNYESWQNFMDKRNLYTTKEAEILLQKKFVWIYPFGVLREFFSKYRHYRKNKNSVVGSYILAREALDKYHLKFTAPFKPLFAFIRFYLIQGGFRDGFYGLYWALGCSHDNVMKYAKYKDMKNGNKEAYATHKN